MTRYICTGRLTRDPETRASKNGTPVTTFRLAIERPVKSGGEKQADYFNFVAFGKTAEVVSRYCEKGKLVLVESSPRNNDYTKQDGTQVYGVDFYVDRLELIDSRRGEQAGNSAEPEFSEYVDDGNLPF